MNNIKEAIENVRYRIKRACELSSRDENEVTLMAVTKTRTFSEVLEAYKSGICDFGENKVSEICEKQPLLQDAKWHMIGHLQKNKIKKVIDKVSLIHSVDSLSLLNQIQKIAENMNIDYINILIEVNVSKEKTKFGINSNELPYFVEALSNYNKIRLKGLMTVAPFVDNPEKNRKIFSSLRELALDISKNLSHNNSVSVLSMGMSNDFEVAIKEGSTMVRVGTDIFGERGYI